jgi:hypothetical protein
VCWGVKLLEVLFAVPEAGSPKSQETLTILLTLCKEKETGSPIQLPVLIIEFLVAIGISSA